MIYVENDGIIKKLSLNTPLQATGTQLKVWEAVSDAPDPLQDALNAIPYIILLTGVETMKIAIIKDEKPQGSNGGTFTAGSWIQRTLNTTLDPAGLASLASNTITIVQGGNYYIRALAPAYGVYSHQARLLVNGNSVAIGTTNYTHPTYGGMNHSVVVWCGNLIAGNTVTLEHRCFGTQATYGFGTDSGQTWGNNVYSVVEIIQYS